MLVVAAPPNEWSCQAQNGHSSDGMWDVEWGTRSTWEGGANAGPKSSWHSTASWGSSKWQYQSQTMACPAMYCMVPNVLCAPTTQNASLRQQALRMHQFSSGASYVPSTGCTSAANDALKQDRNCKNAPSPNSGVVCRSEESTTNKGQELMVSDAGSGELPSVGSAGHFDGTCKRCAFFPKGRCKNGFDCTHCHLPHEPRSRLRRRGGAKRADTWDEQGEEDVAHEEVPLEDQSGAQSEELFDILRQKPTDEVTEDETTEPSAAGPSDSEEGGTACGCTDSEKILMAEQNASSSSDSELVSPQSTMKSKKSEDFPKSTTSWAAQQRARKSGTPDIHEDLQATNVARTVRALLNKLTEERFEVITTKILDLPFSTPEQLDVVVAEVFEKSTTENCFRSLYAELCTRLDKHLAGQSGPAGGKAFRKALVSECQATFERNLQQPEMALFKDLPADEKLEAEIKLKAHRLGNMRFIGELVVRRLLAPKLMLPIVHELLSGDASALEDLIALLTVAAPCFEDKASIVQAPFKDAFAKLRKKSKDEGIPARLRYQICDLLDARDRGWSSRLAT